MKKTGMLNRRVVIFFLAFLIPFVMVQIFWALCGVYPFGEGSILTGDMDLEFVNFYAYFINIFRSKNDFSYMLAKTLGGDFPGLAAFQLHDPLLFVLFLFPGERIAEGIQLVYALQLSIAGFSMSVLLNSRYKTSFMSLIFSTAYAFCGFFFGYLVLTIYFGALAILPLVIYFFLQYMDDSRYGAAYVLLTALFIYINFHMGFMLVIFLTFLFISRIIADTGYVKRTLRFVTSGITVLFLDGFFLVRTGLSLIGEKTTDTADYGFYRRFPLNQVFAGLFSGTSRNDLRPLIYCSVAALFFFLVYLLSDKYGIREKLSVLFMAGVIIVSMWINLFDAVWHGFNNPEGFYWRYSYYLSFIITAAGYKGFCAVFYTADEDRRSFKTVIIPALVLILYMGWLTVTKNAYLDRIRLGINLILTGAIFAGALMISRKAKSDTVPRGQSFMITAGCVLLALVSASDMLYNAEVSYLSLNSYDGSLPLLADFKQDYRDIGSAVDYIKKEDTHFYRIEKDFDRAVNDPALFDYIGLSHDSSCEKDEILDWLINFGFCKTVYYTYYNGGSTSFMDSLFGVKYYISRFDTVEKPYEHMPYVGKYHVYHNDTALPMAFADPGGLGGPLPDEDNTFELQNKLAGLWYKDSPIYIKARFETDTENVRREDEGRYIRTDEEAYIVYNIQITEEKPLYFYFSAPGRQGGEVFVNGNSAGLYFTENHWNVLCAGRYKKGDVLTIKMKLLEDELTISEPCFYYEDEDALRRWAKAAQSLNAEIGAVEEISSSRLSFDTDTKEDRTVILTLPYDDCWHIKIDGKRTEPVKVMGMLLGAELPKGAHRVEMRYIPRGTVPGAVISALGLVMFLFVTITAQKAVNSNEITGI